MGTRLVCELAILSNIMACVQTRDPPFLPTPPKKMSTKIYDLSADLPELNMVFPPCLKLRRMRLEAGLTQPKLAVLCYLAMLQLECKDIDESHPARTANPETLMRAIIFLKHGSCLDSTHLSKFEKGHQRPWKKARLTLCFVFSKVFNREIDERELFPEIDLSLDTDYPTIVEMLERERKTGLM